MVPSLCYLQLPLPPLDIHVFKYDIEARVELATADFAHVSAGAPQISTTVSRYHVGDFHVVGPSKRSIAPVVLGNQWSMAHILKVEIFEEEVAELAPATTARLAVALIITFPLNCWHSNPCLDIDTPAHVPAVSNYLTLAFLIETSSTELSSRYCPRIPIATPFPPSQVMFSIRISYDRGLIAR